MVASTAHWIAAVRARETRRPDRLFADPFADELAGERGVAMMNRSERVGGGENRFIPVRVRWFDDAILAEVSTGVRQVVLLGAGFDTRPYRLDLPPDLDWYELDRPEILAGKESVLAGSAPRCRRHGVVADLGEGWIDPLLAGGFDPARRTVWVAEGLFFYLTEPSIRALLRRAAGSSAAGSAVLADVIGTAGLDGPKMRPYRDYCERTGLPPPFGADDPAALLESGGWQPYAITAPGAPEANWGRLPAAPAGVFPGRTHLVVGRLAAPDRH
jgi:methyltransferase (TIGR00027 family)